MRAHAALLAASGADDQAGQGELDDGPGKGQHRRVDAGKHELVQDFEYACELGDGPVRRGTSVPPSLIL